MGNRDCGWGIPIEVMNNGTKLHYFFEGKSACKKYRNGYHGNYRKQIVPCLCCRKCHSKWREDLAVQDKE